MKSNIFIKISLALLAVAAFGSCEQENLNSKYTGGKPQIRYVRVTAADKSDSLITSAYLGNTVALIGDNMAGTNAVYFNDQRAVLNPDYVTDHSIIVTIPNSIPGKKMDIIKLCSPNDTLIYTFETKVPVPNGMSMVCEYVPDGQLAVINGFYFVNDPTNPLKVTFQDGIEGEIVSSSLTQITVKVPNGAQPGKVTISSAYGDSQSSFAFRDNGDVTPTTHLLTDMENPSTWNGWGLSAFASADGCSGQYWDIEGTLGSWAWPANNFQLYYVSPTGTPLLTIGSIDEYAIRFEANVLEWSDTPMLMWFDANASEQHNVDGTAAQCHWRAWLQNGQKTKYSSNGWQTFTFPLKDFNTSKDETETRQITSLDQLGNFNMMFFGAADASTPVKMYIDNIRLVKIQ